MMTLLFKDIAKLSGILIKRNAFSPGMRIQQKRPAFLQAFFLFCFLNMERQRGKISVFARKANRFFAKN
jgi:hypothetical protein